MARNGYSPNGDVGMDSLVIQAAHAELGREITDDYWTILGDGNGKYHISTFAQQDNFGYGYTDDLIHHYHRATQKPWSFCVGSGSPARVAGTLEWMRDEGELPDWRELAGPRRGQARARRSPA